MTQPQEVPEIPEQETLVGGIFSSIYWKQQLENSVASGAYTALVGGAIEASTDAGDALTWDYKVLGGAFLAGAVLSVLKGLIASRVNSQNSPQFTR